MSQKRATMPSTFNLMPKILICIFLQFFGIFVESSPLRQSSSQFSPFRQIRQSQPILGKLTAPIVKNLRQFDENLSPPHCSRATVTLAHSSKLTKRSATSSFNPNSSAQPNHSLSSTQLSLNIGIGQTVCFTATGKSTATSTADVASREKRQSNEEEEQKEDQVLTVPKSNFSFIVALAKQPKRGRTVTAEGSKTIPDKKGKITKELEQFPANRVLHSISVLDLEQFHAITERYRFAIPELETRCICECESETANCAAARYKYGRCGEEEEEDEMEETKTEEKEDNSASEEGRPFKMPTKSLANSLQKPIVCHRTFFANQPTGRHCSKRDQHSSTARLCCQLRFRPYQGRTFTALRLENAVSSVLLQYSQWGWGEMEGEAELENGTIEELGDNIKKNSQKEQHWMELERRKIRIQLDGAVHNTVLSESAGLKLSVLGLSGAKSSAAQLEPGIYFAENQLDGTLGELIGQLPVNRITEHDFHKLGWFRLDERGQSFVQSGEVFLDRLHHAKVDDCAEQRFRSVLDASYYVNADNNASTQFKMADPLHFVHKWIRSARVLDSNRRIALVRAREGLSLEVTLMTGRNGDHQQNSEIEEFGERRRTITFVHNSSRLADFTAMLVIDRFSNSMLNLMLFDANGVLNGYVRPLNDLDVEEIDGFSVNVPSNVGTNQSGKTNGLPISIQVRIRPYPLGSIHVVCLRPDDAESIQELCRPVQSVYHELEVNTVRNEWNEAIGACKKCNQITAEGFAKYLNPANWTKGISSFSEALMLISDIICYFIAIMILYAFLAKVVFPMIGCCCTAGCLPTPASIFCKTSNKK